MKHLSIAHVAIRQHQGLYSLNDLHRASGGEDKHQPAFFVRNEQTKALITKLYSANLQSIKTKEGKGGGTYACKELVIAYAAWISADFHLEVINVFLDSLQKRKTQTPLKQLSDAARAFKTVYQSLRVLDLNKNAAAISANQAVRQQSELDFLALTGNTHLKAENQSSLHYNATELGQQLGGLSAIKVNQRLERAGLQSKAAGYWLPTPAGRAHAFISDTGKTHSSGAPIQQVRWFDSVLALIEPAQNRLAA